jgi:DNA-binding NarL/FixJ family response regulator
MLQDFAGVEVIGEASSLDDAVAALPAANADVVLVDLFAPDRETEMLAALRAAAPGARLLLYTGMPESHVPPGADGHVHKSAPFDSLYRAICDVAARPAV